MVLRMIQSSKINYEVLRKTYHEFIEECNNNNESTIQLTVSSLSTSSSDNTANYDDDNNNNNIRSIQDVINNGILPATLPEQIPSSIIIINNDQQQQQNNDNVEIDEVVLDEQYDNVTTEFINNIYRILFDIHIQDGQLQCPITQRLFPIKDGIPNMILHEDEL